MPMDIAIKYTRLQNRLTHFYQHWMPADPLALVVYVHGLGDHIGRYSRLVTSLTSANLAVALYDQRGHGRSDGRRGHVEGFGNWVEDLAAFVQFSAERQRPEIPVFIVGQSLGALVAINYVLTHATRVAGLVTISAALHPTVTIPRWKRGLATRLKPIAPWMSIDSGVRIPDLTSVVPEVEALSSDPLFHTRLSISAGLEIERNVGLIGGMPHRIHEPLLMLAGTADRICDPQASSWFTARASSIDKGCKVYEGMRHDLLHDHGWEEALLDIRDWIAERAGMIAAHGGQYHLGGRIEVWQNVSHGQR
ncbi:MAG: lysophospholipase [Proteobacteria bacterium]|nr:lysophospholipase [Pseudomonadota bacterium]